MTDAKNSPAESVVRKSVIVNVPQARAFEVFTQKHSLWWPLKTHHIGADPQTVVIEPTAGGRWFERSGDGVECDWGRVLAWEPPYRLVLSWDIGSDWKYDPHLGTEVEIRFIAEGPEATRVELEHRGLERYGAASDMMRATFDSEGGWEGILRGYAQTAANS